MAQHPVRADDIDKIVVADIYDPFHLEVLEQSRASRPSIASALVAVHDERAQRAARRGDFFLCATGKQRDFWLGQLAARRADQPARPTTTTRACDRSSPSCRSA